jgi:hypothetical protein
MNRDPAHAAPYKDAAWRSTVRRLSPLLVQLWMTAVLLIFVVIRILGSNTVQNVLRRWGSR